MDSALRLKIAVDQQKVSSYNEAKSYLNNSKLFNSLLEDFDITSLNLLYRLAELAEIPFVYEHGKVQKWRDLLAEKTFFGEGFSLSGKAKDLLACYNAMITTVLITLNYPHLNQLEKGIQWILQYQNFERNLPNLWQERGIQKYGGCMKSTPCFIGVVKSTIALSTAKKHQIKWQETDYQEKLSIGLNYVLQHEVYQRRSTNQPITKDILKLSYPFTYKTNIIEILRLLKDNDLLKDNRCNAAIEYILNKRNTDGFWRINKVYNAKIWIDFDKPKEPGEWITYELNRILEKVEKYAG